MQRTKQFICNFCRNQDGGEIIEYALIAGLIAIAAVVVVANFGTKVVAKWTSVSSSL